MTSLWVFDLEVYLNFFSAIFKCCKTQEVKTFYIHESHNDIDELHTFINDTNKWLVGYNSRGYDNQILNYICKNHFDLSMATDNDVTKDLYRLSNLIIHDDYKEYIYQLPFKSLDLMKVGFYRKSLKLLGVNLRWPKLQDLPLPSDSVITVDQVDTILKYNLNDVLITERLFEHLKDNIKLRFDIAKRFKVNVYSESDSGIANRLLEKFYSEASGLPLRSFKDLRTPRKFIPFTQVVFDDIVFHTNTLDLLLEEVKNFNYYKDLPFFKKKVKFDGVTYKMGVGGLHSEDTGQCYIATDYLKVIDADIASMYPTTFINHKLTPAHLGSKFLKNYVSLRDERIEAKHSKDLTTAESLKLVLNSCVGKTLNANHWLYDPLVNLRVTINGQLYLLMLIERLSLAGLQTISANTDGITVLVPTDKLDQYKQICNDWEQDTNYMLEYAYYSKYARRDVNNYIAIKEDGSIKTKGIFTKDWPARFGNMTDPLNKGFDKPIVSIALYNYFVEGTPIKDTILNHTDILDFCIAKRIDDKFTNEYHTITNGELTKDTLQKSVRYYVSTTGGSLFKKDEKGSLFNYEAGKTVVIFNDYVDLGDIHNYNLDYAYYIHAVQQVVDEIINPQLSLWDN